MQSRKRVLGHKLDSQRSGRKAFPKHVPVSQTRHFRVSKCRIAIASGPNNFLESQESEWLQAVCGRPVSILQSFLHVQVCLCAVGGLWGSAERGPAASFRGRGGRVRERNGAAAPWKDHAGVAAKLWVLVFGGSWHGGQCVLLLEATPTARAEENIGTPSFSEGSSSTARREFE